MTDRPRPAEQRSLLAAIVESTSDAIFGCSLDGAITSWNPAAQRIYGYEEEEAVGMAAWQLATQDRHEEVRGILTQVFAGQRLPPYDSRHVRKDGRQIRVRLTVSPILDGRARVVGASVIVHDTTQRDRDTAFLLAQREVLEKIATAAPLHEALAVLAGSVEELSDHGARACIMLVQQGGRTLEVGAAPSLPDAFVALLRGLEPGSRGGACGAALRRRESVVVEDLTGDPLWAHFGQRLLEFPLRGCASIPIFGSDGGPLGTFALYYERPGTPPAEDRALVEEMLGTAVIAIERVYAAGALQKQAHTLRTLNQKLEEQLDQTQQVEWALREAVRQKELLLHEVNHRVKNNLQLIISILNLQTRETRSEELRQRFIEAQTRIRALSLVHNQVFESEDVAHVDLKPLLETICRQLASTYGVDEQRVACTVALPPLRTHVDQAIPFALLATEAVSNCFRHAFPDGRGGNVKLDTTLQDQELCFRVQDDGVGMSEAALRQALRNSLGLGMMQALARQLGARLELQSAGGMFVSLRLDPRRLTGGRSQAAE